MASDKKRDSLTARVRTEALTPEIPRAQVAATSMAMSEEAFYRRVSKELKVRSVHYVV